MAKRKRRFFSPTDKVAILKRHLLEQVPVSELCEEHGLHPTVFYRWQKEFFEHGAAAFSQEAQRMERGYQRRIERLERKLERKNEVLSELMEEHVALKKELGEL